MSNKRKIEFLKRRINKNNKELKNELEALDVILKMVAKSIKKKKKEISENEMFVIDYNISKMIESVRFITEYSLK